MVPPDTASGTLLSLPSHMACVSGVLLAEHHIHPSPELDSLLATLSLVSPGSGPAGTEPTVLHETSDRRDRETG